MSLTGSLNKCIVEIKAFLKCIWRNLDLTKMQKSFKDVIVTEQHYNESEFRLSDIST